MCESIHVYIHVFSNCICICPNPISAQKAHLVHQKSESETACMYVCMYVYMYIYIVIVFVCPNPISALIAHLLHQKSL